METRCLHREKVEEQVSRKLVITVPEWLMAKVLEDMVLWGEVLPLTENQKTTLELELLKQVFDQRETWSE